ncbi:unnamed protein product [Aphanomyces euteiches]
MDHDEAITHRCNEHLIVGRMGCLCGSGQTAQSHVCATTGAGDGQFADHMTRPLDQKRGFLFGFSRPNHAKLAVHGACPLVYVAGIDHSFDAVVDGPVRLDVNFSRWMANFWRGQVVCAESDRFDALIQGNPTDCPPCVARLVGFRRVSRWNKADRQASPCDFRAVQTSLDRFQSRFQLENPPGNRRNATTCRSSHVIHVCQSSRAVANATWVSPPSAAASAIWPAPPWAEEH